MSPDKILAMAAAAQQRRNHPISKALIQSAPRQNWPQGKVTMSKTILGRGVKTQLGDSLFIVGNQALMREEKIDINILTKAANILTMQGYSVTYVARDSQVLGVIGLNYALKINAANLMRQLKNVGINELHILSGDTREVVEQAAEQLDIKWACNDMLPGDKAAYVENLTKRHQVVAMVGDGINDAPAMAKAHIGIAMATGGAETAIEAADIALMDSQLDRILFIHKLSDQTLRIIAQNHWFAITTDLFSAMLSMTGIFSPLSSGIAHIFHTLAIVLNSSRLLTFCHATDIPPQS
jgi:cation-transporting P-type ATPase C